MLDDMQPPIVPGTPQPPTPPEPVPASSDTTPAKPKIGPVGWSVIVMLVAAAAICVAVSMRPGSVPTPDDAARATPSAAGPALDDEFIVEFVRANSEATWRDEINSVELVAFSRLDILTDLTSVNDALDVCEAGRLFLRDLARERYGDDGSDDVRVQGRTGIGWLAETRGGPCAPYEP